VPPATDDFVGNKKRAGKRRSAIQGWIAIFDDGIRRRK